MRSNNWRHKMNRHRTTETSVGDENSTWHAINTGNINSTKETSSRNNRFQMGKVLYLAKTYSWAKQWSCVEKQGFEVRRVFFDFVVHIWWFWGVVVKLLFLCHWYTFEFTPPFWERTDFVSFVSCFSSLFLLVSAPLLPYKVTLHVMVPFTMNTCHLLCNISP